MAAVSHKGLIRKNNQDFFFLDSEKERLFIVADGMGGHKAGEIASQLAVEAAVSIMMPLTQMTLVNTVEFINKAFEQANKVIQDRSEDDSGMEDMGTTMTMAFREGNALYVGHIGDSRAYFVTAHSIKKITKDHTLVEELVRNGSITTEEARNHPQRNIIMKALGSGCQHLPDIQELEIEGDMILFLCTDGITNLVTEEEIKVTLNKYEDLRTAVNDLKDLALERGAHDNLTALAVRLMVN